MILRLISTQIVEYWEIIKWTIVNVDHVQNQHLEAHLNSILHDLLADNSQCVFRIDPDSRKLCSVIITRIEQDKISNEKILVMQNAYSFEKAGIDIRKREREFLIEFAKDRECSFIKFTSPHKAAWKLGEMMGFKEIHRTFVYRL